MIKGFKQLKNVEQGEIVRFRTGGYAIISEYRSEKAKHNDAFISGSGENLVTNGEMWVAVLDVEAIVNYYGLFDDIEYPVDKHESWQSTAIDESEDT